jgi:phenylalanyl-tRNA synthetase alpha chain
LLRPEWSKFLFGTKFSLRKGEASLAPTKKRLENVMVNEAKLEVGTANTLAELQEIRVKYLGKKGLLTNELKTLGNLTPDDRKIRGQALNIIKTELEALFDARESDLKNADLERKLSSEAVDVTLPGIPFPTGGYHLITRIIDDLADIYKGMGYGVVQGPEVETEHYNFDALNIPGWHPARDLWDTFWLTDNRVLRTHTSPMQARFMQAFEPPLKIVVPGKVYRFEQVDATHEAMFHQLEGLAVGPNITMSDLKGTLTEMGKALFGPNAKIRFQPSYYPFTEPSADFAIYWEKEDRWLELGGSGMVHPRVFEEVSKLRGDTVYAGARGFAFGLGIERLAMIKYRIPDIRYFFQNDLRVLRQFRGALE